MCCSSQTMVCMTAFALLKSDVLFRQAQIQQIATYTKNRIPIYKQHLIFYMLDIRTAHIQLTFYQFRIFIYLTSAHLHRSPPPRHTHRVYPARPQKDHFVSLHTATGLRHSLCAFISCRSGARVNSLPFSFVLEVNVKRRQAS